MRLWIIGLACAIGLTLGSYFLGAGIFDLCYDIGPIRPETCASGGPQGERNPSLAAIGISLALVSLIVLASVVKRRGSSESSAWVVWFVRSVFVVGIFLGILIFYGSLDGLCNPFGPFATTGTFCPSFNPYEAIGPLLALISLIGLVRSFLTQRSTRSGTAG